MVESGNESYAASVRSSLAGAHLVAPAVIFSTAMSLLLLMVVARILSPPEYSVFMGFWGAMFGLAAVPVAIEQEATRLLTGPNDADVAPVWGALLRSAGVVLTALLLVEVAGIFLLFRMFGGYPELTLLLGLSSLGFVSQFLVRGLVLGLGDVRRYAAIVALEPILRLAALALPLSVGGGVLPVAGAMVVGCMAWVVGIPEVKRASMQGRRPPLPGIPSRVLRLGASQVLSAVMITGFPAIARAAVGPAAAASLGPFFAAVTLSRLPLIILLTVQSLFVPAFTRHVQANDRRAATVLAARLAVGAMLLGLLSAVAALAGGPWALETFFGDAYRADGLLCSLLVLAAAVQGVVTIMTALLVALDRHSSVMAGWAVAVFVSMIAMAAPAGQVEPRLVLALYLGPACALAVLARAVRRAIRSPE